MKTSKIVMIALFLLISATAWADSQFVSEYSSLSDKDCKTAESGVGYILSRCPAHDGYGVAIADDEGSSSVTLKVKGKDVVLDPTALKPEAPLAFELPFVGGDKLEWRYHVDGGKKSLVAVIYRVIDNSWKEKQSVLFVTRAQGDAFCPLGIVKTNEAAQKLADGGQSCSGKK